MVITGEDTEVGTALLLAAAPMNRGRLIDAASVLPPLAAVPPSVLTGTRIASIVELADPIDPQTVLTRLRAAAAASGPLAIYIAGQLHMDPKRCSVHLALAHSTASTVRYTALPWFWLVAELKVRRPGTTTVVVDLVAAADAWRQLQMEPLQLSDGIRLYGRIVPRPPRQTTIAPDYLRAYAEVWRSGARPTLAQLHKHAAAYAGPDNSILLAVDALPTTMSPKTARPERPLSSRDPAVLPAVLETPETDPHPAILAAAMAGRHAEAAEITAMWERLALRIYGPGSPQAIHWLEVRADLARLAQDPVGSCELWLAAAEARLALRQAVDDADVEAAVDRAHHQWERVADPVCARSLASGLGALRRRVPGRQRGAQQAFQRRLAGLRSAAGEI